MCVDSGQGGVKVGWVWVIWTVFFRHLGLETPHFVSVKPSEKMENVGLATKDLGFIGKGVWPWMLFCKVGSYSWVFF